jgi:ABC-type multidrug transport system fused ATPase/permease subunit
MKNKFKIVVIGLIAAIILPSCNSSLTITKRRASKGYYIDYSKIKRSSKAGDFEIEAKAGQEKPLKLNPKKAEPMIIALDSKKIENFPRKSSQTTTADLNSKTSESTTKLNQKTSSNKTLVPFSKQNNERLAKNLKNNTIASKIKSKMSPQPVEGALSLIWIVILVLLILWALGLLAGGWGLGGLINILLVIALILLILWLLRII